MSRIELPRCLGTPEKHCCHLPDRICPNFGVKEDGGIECKLRTELGDWKEVYLDPRHDTVKEAFGYPLWRCGDYPAKGNTCGACGVSG